MHNAHHAFNSPEQCPFNVKKAKQEMFWRTTWGWEPKQSSSSINIIKQLQIARKARKVQNNIYIILYFTNYKY